MSKADAQRAMREAKYARIRASGPTRREAAAQDGTAVAPAASPPSADAPAAPRARPTARARQAAEAAQAQEDAASSDAAEAPRCGHTSMNGRSCTREAGHAEKNHRYS